MSEYSVAIPTNSETFVEIDPQVTTANLQSLGSIDIVWYIFVFCVEHYFMRCAVEEYNPQFI